MNKSTKFLKSCQYNPRRLQACKGYLDYRGAEEEELDVCRKALMASVQQDLNIFKLL